MTTIVALTAALVSGCGGSSKQGSAKNKVSACEAYRADLGVAINALSQLDPPPEPTEEMTETQRWEARVETVKAATETLRPATEKVVAIKPPAELAQIHAKVRDVFERYLRIMETLTKAFQNKLDAVKTGREYSEDESQRGQDATKAFQDISNELNTTLATVDARCPPPDTSTSRQ